MIKRAFPLNKKLIVANWKMNPESLKEAKGIFDSLKKKNLQIKKTIPVICPPYLYESDLSMGYRGNKFKFGFQDIHFKSDDQSTGEISTEMAQNSKVEYVIIGHSERRQNGETNKTVSLKMKKVIDANLTAILCIGEEERDNQGNYLRFIEEQLVESLSTITNKKVSKLVIAYEPIWAIGKGKTSMDPSDLHRINIFIKKILVSIYSKKIAMNIPILYGGSVDADNAKEIIKEGHVDGLLVGRSSLNPHLFADIIKEVESV